MPNQVNTELFMRSFKEKVEKMLCVERVDFFGSILTSKWKLDKSDVDVTVYSNNIPAKTCEDK
jgi:predicted nucleotidyltransferase